MSLDPQRWRCTECNSVWHTHELLTAPNPFDAADTLTGCPRCKAVGEFEEVCDEAGCLRSAGCGFPVPGGYRRTCSDHYCGKAREPEGT